jgi:hypothetical protein
MTMADIVEQFLRTHIPREQGFQRPGDRSACLRESWRRCRARSWPR